MWHFIGSENQSDKISRGVAIRSASLLPCLPAPPWLLLTISSFLLRGSSTLSTTTERSPRTNQRTNEGEKKRKDREREREREGGEKEREREREREESRRIR